jgi:hypothetical protein
MAPIVACSLTPIFVFDNQTFGTILVVKFSTWWDNRIVWSIMCIFHDNLQHGWLASNSHLINSKPRILSSLHYGKSRLGVSFNLNENTFVIEIINIIILLCANFFVHNDVDGDQCLFITRLGNRKIFIFKHHLKIPLQYY